MHRTLLLTLVCFLFIGTTQAQLAGCMDPEALNYEPDASIDSENCIYSQECPPGYELYTFVNGFGNPPNYFAQLTNLNFQDTLLSIEGFTAFQQTVACLHPDSCYVWHMQKGDSLSYFVPPWILIHDENMATVDALSGGYGYDYRYYFNVQGVNCGNAGCMDDTAMNYASDADIDFGCVYCMDTEVKVKRDTLFFNGNSWGIYQNDSIVNGVLSQGVAYGETIKCLEDGCYEFRIFTNNWDGGASFNRYYLESEDEGLLWSGFRSHYDTVRVAFGVNTDGCIDENEVYGCNNPLAANYDPEVTVYDGTCDFQNDLCSFSFEFIADTVNENVIYIDTEIENLTYPNHAQWNFNDSLWINDYFASYAFTADGPMNVCARYYAFDYTFNGIQPYCEDIFCLEFDPEDFGFAQGDEIVIETVDPETGLKDEEKPRISCYPNPANDILNVDLSRISGKLQNAVLYDLGGRMVLGKALNGMAGNTPIQMDISGVKSGAYILSVSVEGGNYRQRVIIQ